MAAALEGRDELAAVGLARALEREPFAGLVTRVLQRPNDPVDEPAVRRAFEESIYDLGSVGVDEVAFVRELRERFLTALRLAEGVEAKLLYTVTRIEDLRSTQEALLAGQQRMERLLLDRTVAVAGSAPGSSSVPAPEASWEPRMAEAKALYQAGNVRSALRLWERLRDEAAASGAPPIVRARVASNIGMALVELGQPAEAVVAARMALDYAPDRADFVANLAQIELLAGAREDALRDAMRALAMDPASETAWSARIQASPTSVDVALLPNELRESPSIIIARAVVAGRADARAAVVLLRDALRAGRRDPQLLVVLAETLYATLFPRSGADPAPKDVVDDIRRLGAEAEAALRGTERTRLLARALIVQGGAADLARDPDRGSAYFQQAFEADPTSAHTQLVAAQGQIVAGDGGAALYLLDRTPEVARDAAWHAVRVRALCLAGRAASADDSVRAALAGARPAQRTFIANTLLEGLIPADRLDLAEAALALLDGAGVGEEASEDLVEEPAPAEMRHVFRARIALRRDDRAGAERAYDAALAAAETKSEVALEYASYLYGEREYARAAELFAASNAWQRDERAAMQYARSAFAVGQYATVLVVTAAAAAAPGAGGEAPWWVLDLEARIAEEREDVPTALSTLGRLVAARPEVAETRLRYAFTLLRAADVDRAREVLAPLEPRTDLDAEDTTNLARALARVGRQEAALRQAYRALRQFPDNARIVQACLTDVWLGADTAEELPAALFERPRVEPDTWVRLRADDGEEVAYLILADEPHDVRRNEFLATDPRAATFLGLAVGDAVTLHAETVSEKTFRVAELKSAFLHVFHDAMLAFQTRFPGTPGLQMIHVGEGDAFDPTPLVRLLAQREAHERAIFAMYRERRAPLGTVADLLGRSLRRTYLGLLHDRDTPVLVEAPDPERFAAARREAAAGTVVLTVTGVTTLHALGRLDLLAALYPRRVASQSLLDELTADVAEWEAAVAHGGFHSAGLSDDHRIALDAVTAEDARALAEQARALRDAVAADAEVLPRPLHRLDARPGARPEVRDLVGASSFDAVELAVTLGETSPGAAQTGSAATAAMVGEKPPGATLHADDWGLRNVARHEWGLEGCSTYVLLLSARERGLLDETEFADLVERLLAFRHTFVPVDAELLYRTLAESGFEATPRVLCALDVLAQPEVSLDGAVDVTAALLRLLAGSTLGHGALATVTSLALERLTRGRDERAVLRRFAEQASQALRLAPLDLAVVTERVRAFTAARRMA
ncbi:PIN domain-containing protein [Gemmatirosa kalamazoonensis]|uniref:PIN domain-containing protein n=1 Tax=Gemmatirosa kalamazoonensis TaxID=861299 RepID=UPI0011DD88E3|nr:hypothetical protein [Gemmatirosa kalamazoonensis]